LNSPAAKTTKIYDPTISSIRKAKVASNPTDSSLSSRSMSKDKPTSLIRKLKSVGKYISKAKTTNEDYKTPYNKIVKDKRSLPGIKKVTGSSSQRSMNSNESAKNIKKTLVIPTAR
jgi:hypothetical protein